MHDEGSSRQTKKDGDGPDFESWDASNFTFDDVKKTSVYLRSLHKILDFIKSSDCVMEFIAVVALAFVAIRTELEWVGITSVICIPIIICFSALLKFLKEANNGRKDSG